MSTVACVIVQDPIVFEPLGLQPIAKVAITNLGEVRGVDRIVCLTLPELHKPAAAMLAETAVEVGVLPTLKSQELLPWLVGGPARGAEIVAVLWPTLPFLSAAKIEACLRHVRKGKHDSAVLAKTLPGGVTRFGVRRVACAAVLDNLYVVKVSAVLGGSWPPSPPGAVSVTSIEALDMAEHADYVIADALTAQGKM
jgi:hypothetical protein